MRTAQSVTVSIDASKIVEYTMTWAGQPIGGGKRGESCETFISKHNTSMRAQVLWETKWNAHMG
jgi:hypothetical protein